MGAYVTQLPRRPWATLRCYLSVISEFLPIPPYPSGSWHFFTLADRKFVT